MVEQRHLDKRDAKGRQRMPKRIHFKVLSLTYNSLQSSQPTYLRELFAIQPTRSTRSSSCCLPLSRPLVTSHLMFSNRATSITAPRLWNDLPPELTPHHFFVSTTVIANHKTSSSSGSSIRHPPGLPLKTKMSSLQTLLP